MKNMILNSIIGLCLCCSALSADAQFTPSYLLHEKLTPSTDGSLWSTDYRLTGYSAYRPEEEESVVDSMRAYFTGGNGGSLGEWLLNNAPDYEPVEYFRIARFRADSVFTYKAEFWEELEPDLAYVRYFNEAQRVVGYSLHSFSSGDPVGDDLPDDSLFYHADGLMYEYLNGVRFNDDSIRPLHRDEFSYTDDLLQKHMHFFYDEFDGWIFLDSTIYTYADGLITKAVKYALSDTSEVYLFQYDGTHQLTDYFKFQQYGVGIYEALDTADHYRYSYLDDDFYDSIFVRNDDGYMELSTTNYYSLDGSGKMMYMINHAVDVPDIYSDSSSYIYNDDDLLSSVEHYEFFLFEEPTLMSREYFYYEPYEATGIETLYSQALSVQIYPNPVSDVIHIAYSTDTAGDILIRLCNLNGVQLANYYINAVAGENLFQIDLNTFGLPSGVYIVNLISNQNQISKTLIKE